ncbi:MAG: RusA family crossover junction endodeoxyribonuclease [Gemmatimonadales bacterium]|nr:RusA family crossover junction endodeoxyribonuclease [Gemmatimonadales bacterium]
MKPTATVLARALGLVHDPRPPAALVAALEAAEARRADGLSSKARAVVDAGNERLARGRRRDPMARGEGAARPETSWSFVVLGKPVAMQRPRVTGSGTYTPPETRRYKARVAAAARAAGVRAGQGPCRVSVDVWTPDRRRRDLDNILKTVLDGLVKAGAEVLADDACTVVVGQRIEWRGVDRGAPRVEVTVEMADG